MVLAYVALACCPCARALDPSLDISQYAHTSWKVRDGFTKGLIVALAQSPDGYLWLGTEFGLVRFDGVRAVPWQPPKGEQLPGNYIQKLLVAHDGTLWIGTLNGLASWKDGKFTTYPELAGRKVFPLLEDHEGTIWAGGRTKLCSIRNARMDCHSGEGSPGAGVYGLYEDTRQNLWVGEPNGFWRWKPGPPRFFPAPADIAGILGLGEDDQHALLIGVKGGIRRFVNGHFEAHPLPYRGLTTSVQKIFRDRDGSLWVATLTHGLVHVHHGRADTFSSSDGLSGDSVFEILEDREGNVWVATNDGLDRFRPYSVATISRSQGMSNTLTFSALATRDGRVWIATASGLDIWDQGKISTFRPSNGAWKSKETFEEPAPNSLFEDSSGRIWVSTHRKFGYLKYGRFVSVSGYQVVRGPDGWVRGIAEGPPGNLWVASQLFGLLKVFQGKVVQQLSWPALGYEQYANDLAVDPAKKGLWLGFSGGGIAYFAENKVQASYSVAEGLGQGTVNQLRFDSLGTLWAATDGGLSRIKDGHISTMTSRNGLPCDVVYWTIEDEEQAVWLYTMCGLARITRDELDTWVADAKSTIHVKVLDAPDGVGTHSWVEYSGSRPQVTKTKDGKIWFITTDGVSIIDPRHLQVNKLPPPVRIEQVTADDKPYNLATGPPLPSHVHNLTIDYTALSLTAPEKVRFRYKLEGEDPGWREVVNERKVQYSNLPPRHYRFRVIAANNSGVWNEQGDTLEFDIPPSWYQTLWFRVIYSVAFFLFLWSAYLLRVRHLRDREKKLRDVIETMPTFAWTALPDGSLDFVNRRWNKYSGLSMKESAESGWQGAVHPADLKPHLERWRTSLTTGEPFENEVRFRRASDGQYRWFLARAVPLRDGRGKIVKWYGISTDIEDRKGAEQEREQLRVELAHMNRVSVMGELTASISHELKQPITAAIVHANTILQWLRRDPPNVTKANHTASEIIEDGTRASEIIDRLRSLYKKSPPKREPIAVNEVIGEMVGMLRAEATRHAVSIREDLAGNLLPVSADLVQIQQVLMNLMLNGIEAMNDMGGVLTLKSQLRDDGQIQISVDDTGPGLPPDKGDQIFDAFFTTKPEGSGMGLAVSRAIIESHGGRIWANGNGGRGATFHFTLPGAVQETVLYQIT